ncbi:MAG TPA: Trp biosynthesis-associated membrane protein [Mycobacteriales bacterium]|nr:Trp biosynthesis-associated membrane protein [Mycobacteriales bacterium]
MTGPRPGAPRRELVLALAAAGLGALLVLVAGARGWVLVAVPRLRPLADVMVTLSGRAVAPLVPALGLVGLAGVVGLLATRRWGRVAVGVVLAACGLLIAGIAVARLAAPGSTGVAGLLTQPLPGRDLAAPVRPAAVLFWPVLAAVGGLLLAASGTAALLRGRGWPALSGRYDAPAGRQVEPVAGGTAGPPTNAVLWDALDRGHDPTT